MGLAKAIRLSSGERYGVTSACEGSVSVNGKSGKDREMFQRLESSGGSALDWFYHEMRVRYAYQIKLRDTGSYGFLLPSRNIVPTGKEVFNAVTYFGRYLLGNKGIELEEELMTHETGQESQSLGNSEPAGLVNIDSQLVKQNPAEGFTTSEELEEDSGKINWELRRRRRR